MPVLKGKELRIVGFLCNWCSYGGADTAGVARAGQPTDLRIIRVPCSGRVDPLFVLRALLNGADGVLVSGCHPRDCHYAAGNFYARRRLEVLKQFLPVLGIDGDRFAYTWVSASEGQKWQQVVTKFTEQIHKLGPAPRIEDAEPLLRLADMTLKPLRPLGTGQNAPLEELKTAIREKLPELECVIGWQQGYDAAHAAPLFMRTPEDVDKLTWGPFNTPNPATYLPSYKGKKVGVVVKGCDSRSVVELLQENLINRDDVTIFGMPCQGTLDMARVDAALGDYRSIDSVTYAGDAAIVTADGREKPAMQEVRYWYASQEAREAHDAANRRAEELLTLPAAAEKKTPLRVTHGDGALGVKGEDFEILFSRYDGGPVSLISGGREWLWRAPRPAYWRAPTENDRGCRYAWEGAVWSAADAWQRCTDFQILSESERQVSVRYTYTSPVMPDLLTEITYTADASGYLEVSCLYHGGPGRPQMPLFGLRFATPEPLEQTSWLGLSGETYPDRKKGGVYGWHRECPEIPYYLVPQECGCHTDTRAALLYSRDGSELALEMGEKPFAFSAIPYTPWQLEQAAHREELPPPVRTVVTVCGAMRGVGGIDSWRSDVEPAYRVASEKDIAFSFRVRL